MRPKLILAEKPQVARDLARVLKVPQGGGVGCFTGSDYVITWCIGHLVELEEPAAYDPAWKRWAWSGLPMLPATFQLRPSAGTARQWRVVRDLLRRSDFAGVINACDAGREGELIFRLCYELAGSRLPVERLWISSLTDQAIREGMARLRPGQELAALADAARCRSEADWLVGMNGTRAVTLQRRATQDVLCSIGRVQTPTLGLLVRRERQILNFTPRDYQEVHADLCPLAPAEPVDFTAVWHLGPRRRLGAPLLAEEIAGRSTTAAGRGEGPVVETVDARRVREPPPLLFDLTALQRTANRKLGLSAHRTLEVAQALYEQHKLITYPRTDSRYLTSDLIPQLPRIFAAIGAAPVYAPLVAPLTATPPAPPRRVFQDSKARDHHAIIPTQVQLSPQRLAGLGPLEARLFDLIVRRFLGAFYPDAEFEQTRVVVRVGLPAAPGKPATRKAAAAKGEGAAAPAEKADPDVFVETLPPPPDRYEARGRVRLVAGWQEVAGFGEGPRPARPGAATGAAGGAGGDDEPADDEAASNLPRLVVGQPLRGAFRVVQKQTQPPPRYTEATLLGAMESAGRHIENEDLRQEMKDVGLGTPATRAAIIETLLQRIYIERQAKQLVPTPLGMDLVERLPVPTLSSPELTGSWEARLSRVARGEEARAAFMADIAAYVREIVDAVRAAPAPAAVALGEGAAPSRRGAARRPGARSRRGAAAGTSTGPATRTGAKGAATRRKRPAWLAGGETEPTTVVGRKRRPKQAGTATGTRRTPSRRTAASAPPAAAPAPAAASPAPSWEVPPPSQPPAAAPRRAPPRPTAPSGVSRSALAAATAPTGARVQPELLCPRCREGYLLVGRRAWGCSRFASACPLVIPFEICGRRLLPEDLRALVEGGATPPLDFCPAGTRMRARLRLQPGGSPLGFVFLEPTAS